jgi:hypothetical protein
VIPTKFRRIPPRTALNIALAGIGSYCRSTKLGFIWGISGKIGTNRQSQLVALLKSVEPFKPYAASASSAFQAPVGKR